jgi:hypothetical protein
LNNSPSDSFGEKAGGCTGFFYALMFYVLSKLSTVDELFKPVTVPEQGVCS